MNAILLLVLLLTAPVILWLMMRQKTVGKVLCLIVESDMSVTPELCPRDGDFALASDGAYYLLDPKKPEGERSLTRIMGYPFGWPKVFQVPISVALLRRGDGQALDWSYLPRRLVSSTEMGAVMDPKWLANLVHGVQAVSGSKLEKILPLLSVAVGVICMLLLFYMMTKVGQLEQLLKVVK